MSVQLSCPYCNAGVALTAIPPGGRTVCPRCGESFPVHVPAGEDGPHLPVASDNGEPAELPWSHTPGPPARSLRHLGVIGALLGVAVALVGLYLVFRTPKVEPPPGDQKASFATTVPPAALAGLGFLPPETSVAVAVQPGPLLTHADRTTTDPRQALTAAGVPDRVLTTLDRLGLKLEQIDHLTGGLALPADRPLKLVIALRLREPLADRSGFLDQLKAKQTTAASGQTLYNVDAGGFALTMANPDPRTYLFALDPADLAPQPTQIDAHLPMGLRESMAKLSPSSFAWAATDDADWAANPGLKVLAALAKQPDLPGRLAGVRALAVGVSLEPDPQLTAAVRSADVEAARTLEGRIKTTLAGKDALRAGLDGNWVTVRGPLQKDAWAGLESLLPKSNGK